MALGDSSVERLLGIKPAMDAVAALSTSEVISELAAALGAQLVAAIACVSETNRVRAWEAGASPERIESLRAALQATRAIVMTSGNATTRAWFVGTSNGLNLISPLEVLRQDTVKAREAVVRAAFTFATQ